MLLGFSFSQNANAQIGAPLTVVVQGHGTYYYGSSCYFGTSSALVGIGTTVTFEPLLLTPDTTLQISSDEIFDEDITQNSFSYTFDTVGEYTITCQAGPDSPSGLSNSVLLLTVDDDSDGDGVFDTVDICQGFDDGTDTDGDSVPNGCDACQGFNDSFDSDGDGTPDGCETGPNDVSCGAGTIQQGNECVVNPTITNDLAACTDNLVLCQDDLITAHTDLTDAQNQINSLRSQVDDLLVQLASLPQGIIASLISNVETLVDGDILDKKDSVKITKDLNKALNDLEKGNEKACKDVSKFVKDVEKLVKKGDLTNANAQPLLDDATALLAECPEKSSDDD